LSEYPTEDQLIKLLEISRNKEIQKCGERERYVNMFITTSLIILSGGVIVLTYMPSNYYKYFFLIAIGFFATIIPHLFFKHIKWTHRTQTQYLAQCAQLEDMLSFWDKGKFKGKQYWVNDSLMDINNLQYRKQYYHAKNQLIFETKKEFNKKRLDREVVWRIGFPIFTPTKFLVCIKEKEKLKDIVNKGQYVQRHETTDVINLVKQLKWLFSLFGIMLIIIGIIAVIADFFSISCLALPI